LGDKASSLKWPGPLSALSDSAPDFCRCSEASMTAAIFSDTEFVLDYLALGISLTLVLSRKKPICCWSAAPDCSTR
jgi:hypothetical protein